MIIIIGNRATPEQIEQMLEEHKFYIKLAVDIERRILAGGGEMHYFCEQALLEDGSSQKNIYRTIDAIRVRAINTELFTSGVEMSVPSSQAIINFTSLILSGDGLSLVLGYRNRQ